MAIWIFFKKRMLVFTFIATLLFPICAIPAENLKAYSNKELGFSFNYPASWVISETTTTNSKAKVSSPPNHPIAECAVIVKVSPQTEGSRQEELDQVFSDPSMVPSPEAVKKGLEQSVNDVQVISTSMGMLSSHPAFLSRARYNMGGKHGKGFSSGRTATTFTPGKIWTLSCGGGGDTPEIAEKSFLFWQPSINNIVLSFKTSP